MAVIQGGGITNDRSAATRENFALLQQALQSAQTNKYNKGVLALNTAKQAMDLLNDEIRRSGMPPSVFMSRGLGNAYLDTMLQSMSIASGRTLTGDEARQAADKLITTAYDWNSIPVKDRLTFLAGTFGGTQAPSGTKPEQKTTPEPKPPITFQKAADVLTKPPTNKSGLGGGGGGLGTRAPFGGNESTGGYGGGGRGLGTTTPFGGNESTGGYGGGSTGGLGTMTPFGGNESTGGYGNTLGAGQRATDGAPVGAIWPGMESGQQGGATGQAGGSEMLATAQGPTPGPTPQTGWNRVLELAKIGQAVVQQAQQRPQPPTTGVDDLIQVALQTQVQPPPQATEVPLEPISQQQIAQRQAMSERQTGVQMGPPPQQAYPPMTGIYNPTSSGDLTGGMVPPAAQGPQLALPPMTNVYGQTGPVGQTTGITTPAAQGPTIPAAPAGPTPQGNLEQIAQLAQIGAQYLQAQQQAQVQPTETAPRVLPSQQQMAQGQAMSEGQAGVQMAPQTQVSTAPAEIDRWNQEDDYSRAVREFIKSLGGDWDDLPPATVRSMAHTATIFDSDRTIEQEVWDRMNYQRQMEDLPTLNGQEGLFNLFMPMSKAQDQGYQGFEQGLLAKGQRVAQATPTGGVVSANDKSFAKLVGSTNSEEAKAKYPGLYKLFEQKGLAFVKDRWQSYLNSNGLTQIPGGEFLDAASGMVVSGPDDSTFVEDFSKVLKKDDITTVVEATAAAVSKSQQPAKTVQQAAANKVAADTATKVAKATSMDKLFYSNVPSVNSVPAPEPNWLERNAPKVVKAMDEFRAVLGEPTSSFKAQSTAFRAGKEAGSFLNAVWNKMDAQEKASYMQALMEHARSADLTETFFTYGKDFSDSKLVEMGYKAEMMNAAAQSQTAQAKMLGDMMAAASKNIGDTLNSMSDFVAAVVPQAKAAGEKSVDAYIAKNTTLWNLYEGYKKFLAGLAENSGMNLMFGEIYRTQKTGWFGTKKFEITEETPFTKGLDKTKMSPEMQSLIGKYGL